MNSYYLSVSLRWKNKSNLPELFLLFPDFQKNIKITPFSFHLCILAIFKARALKIWLQVGLRMVPKSYFMWPDLKRLATVPPTCKNCVTIHFLGLKCVTKTVWFANIKLDQKRHDLPHDWATFFRGNSSEPPTDANPGNSHQSVSDPGH